jgi:hypothetical protein
MATTLVSVVTQIGKERMASAIGGLISGTLSAGAVNEAIFPAFYQLGDRVVPPLTPIAPPDPTFTALIDPTPFQKSLTANDLQVLIPPHTIIAVGGTTVDLAVNIAEPTLRIRIFTDVNEAVFSPAKTMRELGIFLQFDPNPPDLFVYGTFNPGFVKSAGLTVDLFVDVKI